MGRVGGLESAAKLSHPMDRNGSGEGLQCLAEKKFVKGTVWKRRAREDGGGGNMPQRVATSLLSAQLSPEVLQT